MLRSLLAVLLWYVTVAKAARLLLFPYDHGAHVNYFSVIGQELKSRGHVVDFIADKRSAHLPRARGLNVFERQYSDHLDSRYFDNIANGDWHDQMAFINQISATSLLHTREIFNDTRFIQQLRDNHYDLALLDGGDTERAQLLLPYSLGVRHVILHVRHDPWIARVPAMPSVEGFNPVFALNEHSTFIDRLVNTLLFVFTHNFIAPPSYFSGYYDDLFDELVPERPNIGFEKLFQNSEMFFIVMDKFCLDIPRISAPHYQIIGGMGASPVKPLTEEFSSFMDGAKDGAIILSFGSGLANIPPHLLEPMLEVFSRLKQRVIMRHNGDVTALTIPPNVKVTKWLPQNDLLGHAHARAFITHCGKSGLLEGVYHGVPMLLVPFQSEQEFSAAQAVNHGYGLRIDQANFDKADFEAKLRELLTEPSYTQKIKRCSGILNSLPSAKDTAAFWIEHVITHGSEHLRPYYMDMPLYKFFMLDILAFCMVVGAIWMYCAVTCFKWCCCKSSQKKKKVE